MAKWAFVFPGQGAQAIGMGNDLFEQSKQAQAFFHKANEVLNESLTDLIFHGEEAVLKQTSNTQPALLTTSVAFWNELAQAGIVADYMAGHSLGEYSALVAAGVLSFEAAVALVRQRGLLMERAVPNGQGTMAAILGADRDALKGLCDQITATGAPVELANVNCPGQIVISGSVAGVGQACDQIKSIGAKRAIPLEVSGPFHSSMMKPAAEQLAISLQQTAFTASAIPVVSNVLAQAVEDVQKWSALLEQQVVSPVLWEDSVKWMIEEGVDTFVEIGPGAVLAGLIKKINKEVTVYNVNSVETLQQTIDAWKQQQEVQIV